VLEVDDLVDRAVDLDVVAVLELVGGDQGESVLMESNTADVADIPGRASSTPRRALETCPGRAS